MKHKKHLILPGLIMLSVLFILLSIPFFSSSVTATFEETGNNQILGSEQANQAMSFIVDDFEAGVPTGLTVFSDKIDGAAGGKTGVTATTTLSDLPTIPFITDTTVLSFSYDLIINDWGYAYGGFNRVLDTSQDWSSHDGFSFWFYGMNTGNIIQVEILDGISGNAEFFEYNFTDDVTGWQLFMVDFADFTYATDYQPNPDNGTLELTDMLGYNFGIVTSPSSGQFYIDNVSLYVTPLVIDDFEAGIPTGLTVFSDKIDGAAGGKTGVTATTTLSDLPTIPPITDTNVLSFAYDLIINDWGYAYGGFNRAFDASQDWSSYDGFSFWFYGMNTGNVIQVEIWDGGTGNNDQEFFEYNLTDDVAGWRLFTVDFADFSYATDYQPNPDNGILDLIDVWGYGFGIVTSPSSGQFYIDNVTVYGQPELQVGFKNTDYVIDEGGEATITVTLNMTSTDYVTVTFTTSDGTAITGSDYQSNTGELIFLPNTLIQTFTVQTIDDADEEGDEMVMLTLSNPISVTLGAKSEATLTIIDNDQPAASPFGCGEILIDDFEDGLLPLGTDGSAEIGFVTFNGPSSSIALLTTTIILDTDPMALPGQPTTNTVIQIDMDVTDWGGFTHAFENAAADQWVPQDWTSYEGISFWIYGNNTGGLLFVDILDNRNPGSTSDDAERFVYEFTDDFEGWQFMQIPFADFWRKEIGNGAPNDGLTLTEVHGYAFGTTNSSGLQSYYLDNVALVIRTNVIDDFEDGLLPYGMDGTAEIGFPTWSGPNSSVSLLTTTTFLDTDPMALPGQPISNTVIQIDMDVTDWGGFTHAFENPTVDQWVPQDWSSYQGLCFWVHGNNTGGLLFVDMLDNRNPGSTSDDAERFVYEFTDDFDGWRLMQVDFADFWRKEIGNGAPNDGLNLTEIHGYAFGSTNTSGPKSYYLDNIVIYGNAGIDRPLLVAFDRNSYSVGEGDTATISVTLNMSSTDNIMVSYTASPDRATPDRDYIPVAGSLVFEAGVTVQTFTISTLDDWKDENSEGVWVTLSEPMNAELGVAYEAHLDIVDNDPFDPALVDDFESFPYAFDTWGNVTLDIFETMTNTSMTVPGQWLYENTLSVSYTLDSAGTSNFAGGFGRDFYQSEDWSAYEGLSFWFNGSNSGDTIKLEVLDNAMANPTPADWTLVWSDEFDGVAGTPPDPTVWTPEIGGRGWGNGEWEYYTDSPDNAAMDGNGNLVITAREIDTSTTQLDCWYGTCTHTSARLISEGKAEFAYGRIEARLQVPYGQGIWPAFWMLGGNFREVGWPDSGEIDIMENIGREPRTVHGTLHGPGYSGGQGVGGGHDHTDDLSNDFHVFAIEWQPNEIKWYFDDVNYLTLTPNDIPAGTEWVYDHPFFLLLNVAVGGNWPGYPDETTVFPQTMHVDYVRVYQAADSAERFEATFEDNFNGWQKVAIPFNAFTRSATQPANAPDDGFGLTEVWGYRFSLPANSSNLFYLDRVYLETVMPPVNPPQNITIEGAVTGTVDSSYTFTATIDPLTTTIPIWYIWQADGQTTVTQTNALSDTIDFVWATTGTKTITVVASNATGRVTDTHSIVITEAEETANLPQNITIEGAVTGTVDNSYTFTATVDPTTTTTPISYTWQADGQTTVTQTNALSDTIAFVWATTGTKTITVIASNVAGSVTDTHSIVITKSGGTIEDPRYEIYLPLVFKQ